MRFRWFVVLGLVASVVLVGSTLRDRTPLRAEYCVAEVNGVRAQVDLEQGRWSALMAAIAQRRGLPPRATTIAIATAFQESKIHNIDYGDRDSVGLFQQRPSQGWGSVAEIMDPHYSTGAFYDALEKVHDYGSMKINDAAQLVQRSGHPGAYAQHEDYARALASALRGYSPGRFTCQINPGGSGSTTKVVQDVARAFGAIAVEKDGDDARYPLIGATADVTARGWAIAHYLVGNASELGISQVSFRQRTWKATSSDRGWVKDTDAPARTVLVSTN
ncbi:hypothetical protein [Aeromicrobium chenweiae]|uniref:ARB-07466-like C-terminal domain-containing protein n=1 Tax=Aeromicrobium chenweiae TaxID=2079793 RepID=A0A2S0WNX4_9ACTN|nr:hypothetical protein [Aeromicrobium chenweiae]AWB93035.1 hypothetical protein C3E78_12920 [Aeromicrobium chenweiae]TGN34025.1 hypothetical protein E4L97_02960 [Aeromicrobium chenweiae]